MRLKHGVAAFFKFNGENWDEIATLKPADGDKGDVFGSAVSFTGNTAVIGSYLDDDNGETLGLSTSLIGMV